MSSVPHSSRQLGCSSQPDRAPFTRARETLSVVLCVRQWERRPSHLLPWLSGGGKGQLQLLPKGTRSQLSSLRWCWAHPGRCSGSERRGCGGVLGAETGRGRQRPHPPVPPIQQRVRPCSPGLPVEGPLSPLQVWTWEPAAKTHSPSLPRPAHAQADSDPPWKSSQRWESSSLRVSAP